MAKYLHNIPALPFLFAFFCFNVDQTYLLIVIFIYYKYLSLKNDTNNAVKPLVSFISLIKKSSSLKRGHKCK